MKLTYNNKPLIAILVLFALITTGLYSCKKTQEGGTGTPTITRVRTVSKQESVSGEHQVTVDSSYISTTVKPVAFDSTVTTGNLNGQYAIIGQNLLTTKSVTFNGIPAIFNPALSTDNAVIVTISPSTPFQGSNKIVITTKFGSTSFNFNILQPPPAITDVSQLAGNAGDVITITGTAFDNASAVSFGSVAGQIQASTSTQITVQVPANALGVVSVTTPGGTSSGPAVSYDGIAAPIIVPFGFKHILYDDAINAGYDFNFNGVTVNEQSTTVVKRGTYSIQVNYNGNYAGYAVGSGNPVDLTGITYVKFSIYGATGTEGRVIKVAVNDFNDRYVDVILHEKWSTYVIPINLFQDANATGAPTSLSYVGFQDLSGKAPTQIYLDDIGVF